jgi:hypothetical protein
MHQSEHIHLRMTLIMLGKVLEKIQRPDSQNSDTTAPSGRELYHLQFSLQEVSLETFEYTLVSRLENVIRFDSLCLLHVDF